MPGTPMPWLRSSTRFIGRRRRGNQQGGKDERGTRPKDDPDRSANSDSMRPSEAKYIAEILGHLPNDAVGPCLNVGSSTRHFREVEQPHVDRLVFAPLAQRGIEVTHADLKPAEGVDI